MTTDSELSEWREEAKRLRAIDRQEQRQIIAMHRAIAANRKVGKADRDHARRHADALERFLRLKPRPKR